MVKLKYRKEKLKKMEPQTVDPADGADVVVETPVSETEVVEETPVVEEKAEEVV